MKPKDLYELFIESTSLTVGIGAEIGEPDPPAWDDMDREEQLPWMEFAGNLENRAFETDKHYDKARSLLDRARAYLAAEGGGSTLYEEIKDFLGVD